MDKLINDFSPGLFIMQSVLLLIIILLMRKFAWKPILDSLKSREEGIENAIHMAEQARKEMASLQANSEHLIKEARAERDSMIKDARATADRMIEEAKTSSKVEAEKILVAARQAIQAEQAAAMSEMKAHIASFSIEIAEKLILSELSSDEKQKALASKLAQDIKLN